MRLLGISIRFAVAGAMVVLAALAGCSGDTSSADRGAETAPVSFEDKVWRVSESPAVAPGTLYVFLSEGTLVITSPHSKPALGNWKSDGAGLTMIEGSIPYKVDILELTAGRFRIRSNNPGGSVEITLVPAAR
jgi:hypothetical protein